MQRRDKRTLTRFKRKLARNERKKISGCRKNERRLKEMKKSLRVCYLVSVMPLFV